jgi:hypothetical protein
VLDIVGLIALSRTARLSFDALVLRRERQPVRRITMGGYRVVDQTEGVTVLVVRWRPSRSGARADA